jgi:hypothetical protein
VVYSRNTQNRWDCGLCQSLGIQNNLKAQHFGNWILFLSSPEDENIPSFRNVVFSY